MYIFSLQFSNWFKIIIQVNIYFNIIHQKEMIKYEIVSTSYQINNIDKITLFILRNNCFKKITYKKANFSD